MTFTWFKQKSKDLTPKVYQRGDFKRVDTSSVPKGTGAACGYCRTDLWLGTEKSANSFVETQLDSRFAA